MGHLIELQDIQKYYSIGKEKLHVLKAVNISIDQGDFLTIVGKSGSGKTTLMNSLSFLDHFDEGAYLFKGEDVTGLTENEKSQFRNEYMGFIFQQYHLIDSLTIRQNVELPLLYNKVYDKLSQKERFERVDHYLELVGIQDKKDRKPAELSGGQQQRAAIARALINDPYVIFADEPTGALDSHTGAQIMEILSRFNQEGKTIILVTHDADLTRYASKVIEIIDGVVHVKKGGVHA